MRVAIGSDHAGYELKDAIVKILKNNNYEVVDFGTCDSKSVDYPDYGLKVAEAVKEGDCEKGIIICGTGIGISVSANKVPGVRAALCTNSLMARLSREHNNANVLALGARIVGFDLAIDIVETWLKTEFLGDRHQRRLDKIEDIEKKYGR
ncbi:MAG: ribose 5-phosphate isomerase B [Clostridiaceae bacterium]|jgi:ribose 5-phosphate isomerase B|nr:ribose 5-phosphate isomerase B [Clostridiaceae bacterium]